MTYTNNARYHLGYQLFVLPLLMMVSMISSMASAQEASCQIALDNSRFEVINAGTEVHDKSSGLVWQRCSMGQTWDGTTCSGEASKLEWLPALQQAKQLGNGYRLPSIKELQSLVEYSCSPVSINAQFFPNTPTDSISAFYSNTPYKQVVQDGETFMMVYAFSFRSNSAGITRRRINKSYHYARAVRQLK